MGQWISTLGSWITRQTQYHFVVKATFKPASTARQQVFYTHPTKHSLAYYLDVSQNLFGDTQYYIILTHLNKQPSALEWSSGNDSVYNIDYIMEHSFFFLLKILAQSILMPVPSCSLTLELPNVTLHKNDNSLPEVGIKPGPRD